MLIPDDEPAVRFCVFWTGGFLCTCLELLPYVAALLKVSFWNFCCCCCCCCWSCCCWPPVVYLKPFQIKLTIGFIGKSTNSFFIIRKGASRQECWIQGRCLGRHGSDLASFHHVEKVDCFSFYLKGIRGKI